jgi:hypothetical protein
MSAHGDISDLHRRSREVRKVPTTDSCAAANSLAIRSFLRCGRLASIKTIELSKGSPPVSLSLRPAVPLMKKLSRNRWE